MIDPKMFIDSLKTNHIDHFFGVPDSLLKDLAGYIADHIIPKQHIISANEGNAVALAAGYHLATSKMALVYLQNSGLGNTINPLVSLADPKVYSIPLLLMIGWRGEPGKKDEPQHIRQGEVTQSLLNELEIPYEILDENLYEKQLEALVNTSQKESRPVALLVKKGTFSSYKYKVEINSFKLSRELALKTIIENIEPQSKIISTTGKSSREIFEIREALNQTHHNDFLTVGSMGHVSSIALGYALNSSSNVYCIDGDGSMLMHAGSMAILANNKPENLKYILINNAAHESVGGQPTIASSLNFDKFFQGIGFEKPLIAENIQEIENALKEIQKSSNRPLIINVKIGSRKNLGRPTIKPIKSKENFMKEMDLHDS